MTTGARICLYCSRPIRADERAALCAECLTAHHEECWERNGRCSTFRCPGQPRTLRGEDLSVIVTAILTRMNDAPRSCPFCARAVYGGVLRPAGRPNPQLPPEAYGLPFVTHRPDTGRQAGGLTRLLGRVAARRQWVLPGAQVRARSCAGCHRLFVAGHVVEADAGSTDAAMPERHCPFCAVPLWNGALALRVPGPNYGRFVCDGTPDLHPGWLGRYVLDRYLFNHWAPAQHSVAAASCPNCRYTEIGGVPVYRFA